MPRTMSVTPGNLSLNGTSFFTENHSLMDKPSEQRTWNAFLFCLTFAIALPALLGSIYSLVSLLKLQNKTTLSTIVTSLAADDLISIVPVIIFMFTQWSGEVLPQPLCTTSAFIYLFQGVSSNLKGSLIVSYNFYALGTAGAPRRSSSRRRASWLWAVPAVWTVSLLLCLLPLCGWGRYAPTPWGCFAGGSYIVLLSAVYWLCFSLLAALAVRLSPRLLCSGEPRPEHLRGSAARSRQLAVPPPPLLLPAAPEPDRDTHGGLGKGPAERSSSCTVGLAQKRFSLILALSKGLLWLPMMTQLAVQYITGLQSPSFETLSFLLTLLAATVTPLFVLSQHWLHLPCGCIINCRRSSYAVSSQDAKAKRGGLEFSLSFQRGCGMFRIPRENPPQPSSDGQSTSHHSLLSPDCQEPARGTATGALPAAPGHGCWDTPGDTATGPPAAGPQGTGCDTQAFSGGPEWRLFHQESRTPELSDWEWCRSKSERNPRQEFPDDV